MRFADARARGGRAPRWCRAHDRPTLRAMPRSSRRDPLLGALIAAGLSALTACGPSESAAREVLTKDGYTDVVLTPDGDHFTFRAKKGGQACSGTVTASRGSSTLSSLCVDPSMSAAAPAPACDAASPAACFHEGVAKDRAGDHSAAATLYEKGCGFGDAGSCTNAGVSYERGEGVSADRGKALALYEKACKGKHPIGCSNFGKTLRADGKPKEALAAFDEACALELAEGCYLAGLVHATGALGQKDPAAARVAFEKGCGAKEPSQSACGALGLATLLGEGVPKDATKGAAMLGAACDAGSALACMNLGLAVRDGLVGPRDPKRAEELLAKACKGGESGACPEQPAPAPSAR